ncbi:hypothetical protein [Kitasatospora sp. McL0602]|uniref:hypothetical protein n=1 Tax=Kitasatospora sp. McL0602 TaxID=3439530 RepID=UPI003F8C7D58
MQRARVLSVAGALALGVGVLPAAASADSGGGTLYVNGQNQGCSDSGTGSAAAPYCTIQAAADVVTPGQTVLIDQQTPAPGVVHVTRSGTESAPITFTSAGSRQRFVVTGLTVTGASHLRFQGMGWGDDGVTVSGADDIGVDHGETYGEAGQIHVTDGSAQVRVTRSWFTSRAQVVVDKGSTGTVVSGNDIEPFMTTDSPFVSVNGATGTAVTGNTLHTGCGSAVDVSGRSTGTTIENNVLKVPTPSSRCAANGIQVAEDSAATTKSAYNLFNPIGSAPLYLWAGVSYRDLLAFRAATGQGDHDLAGPQDTKQQLCQTHMTPPEGSPVIDSADSTAPGALPTDIYDTPRADDPTVPDSGAGGGHYDRGAVEVGVCPFFHTEDPNRTLAVGARGVRSFLYLEQNWDLPGTVTVDWGDGTTTAYPFHGTPEVPIAHTYDRPGTYRTTATASVGGMTWSSTYTSTTTGAQYKAITPTRVLDTRNGTGTGGRIASIPARGVQRLDLSKLLPEGVGVNATVLNITAVNPGAAGFITAYESSRPRPLASTLNFTRGAVVANLATLGGEWIDFYNGSDAPVDLVVDLAGYYQPSAGDGYHPATPTRLLDTRLTTAARPAQKVPAHGSTTLKVAGAGPVAGDATAVMLNVTEAGAAAPGFVTAYPAGIDRPTASNLNFTAGAVVPNSTVVPVGADGSVTLYNGSSAPLDLVVDVQGYYSPTGGLAFRPVTPTRVLDTRDGTGSARGPVAPFTSTSAYGNDVNNPYDTKAAVFNTTVTRPAAFGFLTAYPAGAARPTASNLNFAPNQTVAAMTVSGLGSGSKVSFYDGSYGQVDVVADLTGFFY